MFIESTTNQASRRKTTSPLHHGFLIHDVSRLRRTVFDMRMRPLGITRAQWWVLTNLSRHDGDNLTQVELARLLDVGKGSLGRLIDRLEKIGCIVRTADPIDRRAKRISVSGKGRELVLKMESIALELNACSVVGITPEEQQALVRVLTAMKRNLFAMDAVPSVRRRKRRDV